MTGWWTHRQVCLYTVLSARSEVVLTPLSSDTSAFVNWYYKIYRTELIEIFSPHKYYSKDASTNILENSVEHQQTTEWLSGSRIFFEEVPWFEIFIKRHLLANIGNYWSDHKHQDTNKRANPKVIFTHSKPYRVERNLLTVLINDTHRRST